MCVKVTTGENLGIKLKTARGLGWYILMLHLMKSLTLDSDLCNEIERQKEE